MNQCDPARPSSWRLVWRHARLRRSGPILATLAASLALTLARTFTVTVQITGSTTPTHKSVTDKFTIKIAK
jgi:hypothetical protein